MAIFDVVVVGGGPAVCGEGKDGVELACEMKGWSVHIIFCGNGDRPDIDSMQELERLDIKVECGRISGLEGSEGMLRSIRMEDGRQLACSALFFSSNQKQHSSLARDLGCDLCDRDYVQCGEGACTSVARKSHGLVRRGDQT